LLKKEDRILEFGPLIKPLVSKKDYPNIFFADIRSTEDIKKLYTANDYLEATGLTVDINAVAEIDYVIKDSYTKTFKNEKKFDAIYLSHVIEHMPDIVFFLKDVANILSKDGKLILLYPDARYCFDHFRNGTSFIDAYDVYKNKENSRNRVFDFVYNVVSENNPKLFWNDTNITRLLPNNTFNKALKAYDKAAVGELPEDVHFWPFSDYQFVKFLYDMDRAGLLDFDISFFHETQPDTQEFMIVLSLKKKQTVAHAKYQKILSGISTANKANAALKEKNELLDQIANLQNLLKEQKLELERIYSSKKWRIASKAADVKGAVFRRKHE
jgi:SAM-dependent methyltransferase